MMRCMAVGFHEAMSSCRWQKRSTDVGDYNYWPEGALFRNPFGTGPPEGPLSPRQRWVWVRFRVREDFFYAFINAESTVATFNNTIEVKVYIHECIFWGCSVDHFREENLAIFDHKIYP
jgi:hypothetical protein